MLKSEKKSDCTKKSKKKNKKFVVSFIWIGFSLQLMVSSKPEGMWSLGFVHGGFIFSFIFYSVIKHCCGPGSVLTDLQTNHAANGQVVTAYKLKIAKTSSIIT